MKNRSIVTSAVKIPKLSTNEVGVSDTTLGEGGFCSVSSVRWIKINDNDEDQEKHVNLVLTKEDREARRILARRFAGYQEKYYSLKNIVVPGYNMSKNVPSEADPMIQKPPRIALKRVKSSLKKERYKIGVKDLMAEISVLSKCSHPNIINLYAVGCDKKQNDVLSGSKTGASSSPPSSSLTTEIINFAIIDQLRSTLRKRLYKWKEDRSFAFITKTKSANELWLEQMVIILKIADAIQYLHSNGIIHRDINPDNIGFTDDNVVKLFDFGLAKNIRKDEEVRREDESDVDANCRDDNHYDDEVFDLTSNTGTMR